MSIRDGLIAKARDDLKQIRALCLRNIEVMARVAEATGKPSDVEPERVILAICARGQKAIDAGNLAEYFRLMGQIKANADTAAREIREQNGLEARSE